MTAPQTATDQHGKQPAALKPLGASSVSVNGLAAADPTKIAQPDTTTSNANSQAKQEEKAPLATTPSAQKLPEPILGFVAPNSWVGKELSAIGTEFLEYRKNTISALPRPIVNNNSNFLGATELVAEVFMFKSSGLQLYSHQKSYGKGRILPDFFSGSFQEWLETKHAGLSYTKGSGVTSKILKGLNPIIEPVYNIARTVAGTGSVNFNPKDLVSPKFYKESVQGLFNIEKATEIDRARFPGKKLVNRWQTRSTTLGLIGMSVATFMPDDKDSPEDVKKYTEMAATNPVGYVITKLGLALNPLQWWENKRSFVGLMKTLGGTATLFSGFRNVDGNNAYFRNGAHAINGAITAAAGSQLFWGVDGEQAWGRYGTVMAGRMFLLPKSIKRRYAKGDPARHFYGAGQATFQIGNLDSFLIGGAEKLEDGTIIDHKAEREKAKEIAKAAKEAKHSEKIAKKEAKHHRPEMGEKAKPEDQANNLPLPDTSKLQEQPPITTVQATGSELTPPQKQQNIAAA